MPPDPKGSLAVRISNLRKVNSNLEFYLSQVMNHPIEDPVDVSKIARNSDEEQLMKLLRLVISVAVQCQQKEKVISRILQLPEACQHELMIFIKKILEDSRPSSMNVDPSDFNKLKQFNQELVREVESLKQELSETRKEHELFRLRVEKLLDEKPAEKSTLNVELEGKLMKEMDLTQDLTRQLAELKRQHTSEIVELRDELDIANERILQLSKLEPAIEKLKAKNEETTAIKQNLHEVNMAYEALQEKMRIFEEQHSADIQVHEALAIFKVQFSQEKSRNIALSLRIESLEQELRESQKQKGEVAERCKLLEAKSQQLNEQIASMLHREESPPGISLSDQSGVQMPQRTIDELQKHFNEQLDKLLREKILIEEKCKAAIEEIESLRQHPVVMRVEDQETKALLRVREEEVGALTDQRTDLMQRLEQVSNELRKVDPVLAENERLRHEKENLMTETAKIYREKDEIGRRIIEYKDAELKHMTELVEKDKQVAQLREEIIRLHEQGKYTFCPEPSAIAPGETPEKLNYITEALKKLTENKDLSQLLQDKQTAYESLEKHCQSLQSELTTAKLERSELASVKEELLELKRSHSQAVSKHKQTLSTMEIDLGTRDKRMLDAELREKEFRKMMTDEEKLMVIALHELGMEVFKQHAEKNGAAKNRS